MAEGGMKVLKYGCLGCGGLFVLALMAVLIVGGVAWQQKGSEEVEQRTLTHDVPVVDTESAEADAPVLLPGDAAGRVELDFRHAEFKVRPGAPGEGMRVEAEYDVKSYELLESFEERDDGGWFYRVEFARTGGGFVTTIKEMMGGTKPKIVVVLPTDSPYALQLSVDTGGVDAEIGGLTLTSVDAHVSKGGVKLSVSEPTKGVMERMTLRGSMGGLALEELGNASPSVLDAEFNMGGIAMELGGAWRRDADITIDVSMGGGAVELPRTGVRIEGLDSQSVSLPPESEIPVPTLRFTLEGDVDNIEFTDWR
ncbi:MAG: hypothetical protein GY716_19840 [bacterium]|nr:hypothetical protein [bacterium]